MEPVIYASDIEEFGVDDWEDLFCNGIVPCASTWEGWKERRRVEFMLDAKSPWARQLPEGAKLPTRDDIDGVCFFFDFGERGKPLSMSEELEYLIKDVVFLKEAKTELYRSLHLYTESLEDGVNMAADAFADAYDGAMAEILVGLVAAASKEE